MKQVPPAVGSLLISSIMSSTDYGSPTMHMVYGMVLDEKGNNVNGADVLIESTVERKRTTSSMDGSFLAEICIFGSFDEIQVMASMGQKSGTQKICAGSNPTLIDVVLH